MTARPPKGRTDWTPREREVARLLATGATDRQIAAELGISRATVSTHVEHISRRSGLRGRAAIAAAAVRAGIA